MDRCKLRTFVLATLSLALVILLVPTTHASPVRNTFYQSPMSDGVPLTMADFAAQLSQIDIQSMLLPGTQSINATLLAEFVSQLRVGSILNSPSSNDGWVPTIDEWRLTQEIIYNISSTMGDMIPILYGIDTVHGANYIFNATLFPQQIGMAATFNTTVAFQAGRVAGIETRYAGIPWVFSPILGLAVQPSWARVFETFGEDPKLVGDMGVNIIQGLQSPPPSEMGLPPGINFTVAACMKHYIGYTNIRTGHDRTPVFLPMNILLQYFAPPFQRAITEANVLSVMENYIELNGRPVVASSMLLKFLLRTEMGFEGMMVTDYNEIFNLYDFHMAAGSYKDALQMSLNATTIDMAMVGNWSTFPFVADTVLDLIEEKLLDAQRVNQSAQRVLQLKEQVGLFAGSPVPKKTDACMFACASHRQQALDATRQSIVLLQNNNTMLPITTMPPRVAVVGQGCDSIPLMAGGWTIRWQGTNNRSAFPYGSTVFEELTKRFPASNVTFDKGCNVTEDSVCGTEFLQSAVANAKVADVTIVCVGERHYAEKPGDINDLTLPGQQIEMVRQLRAVSKKVVLVLVQGRPRILQDLPALSDAVINAMLPGPAGGEAIVDVLTGVVNPSGRQPITYPLTLNNAPIQYWRKYSANTGGDYSVQWEFGHGLSYTTFTYSNMQASLSLQSGAFVATVTVTNTGPRDGSEAVLLYSTQTPRPITPEVQMLRAFTKVFIPSGASKTVSLEFPFRDIAYYDEFNCQTLQQGPLLFTISNLNATANFPRDYMFSCSNWGTLWQENTGAAGVLTASPSPQSPQTVSSTSDYIISSVVCFGAGIAGTAIIISYLRRRSQPSATETQLLEPSGV